jgi:hypothetical protein
MANFDDVHTLDYTTEELQYFETEMRKYRLPWITKMHKKYGVPFIRFTFLPALIIIAVLGFIYMGDGNYGQLDWMWTVDKCIALFYIGAFGLFTLVSHIFELVTTNRLRRRLGLSQRDFRILVIAFQITGMEE